VVDSSIQHIRERAQPGSFRGFPGKSSRSTANIAADAETSRYAPRAVLAPRALFVAAGSFALASARAPRADRVLIPAGSFQQGSTRGDDDERPVRTVTLKAFAIDRTEVTRADYARCVSAGRCKAVPAAWAAEGDGRLPVTGVDWRDAQAYCRFASGRLPSEAEWEKAARGADGREYPWGDAVDCAHANWGSFQGEGPCAGKNPGAPEVVGSRPAGASPYGVLDLGGNVWEWVADRYDDELPVVATARKGRSAGERRVVRGGSCCSYFVGPRAANRNAWAPEHRDGDLGFRCAGGPGGAGK
jgi:formylglycine-generating enzyme required for sulfatase activity